MLTRIATGSSVSGSVVKSVIAKAKGMYKQEEIAYQGAFLAEARAVLTPYLQNALLKNDTTLLPSYEEEQALLL